MNKYVLSIYRKVTGDYQVYGVGDFAYIQELLEDYVVTSYMYGKGNVDFRIEDFERYLSKRRGVGEVVLNKCITCKNYRPFYKSEVCKDCKREHRTIKFKDSFIGGGVSCDG
ncbi:hypothetical protein QTI14_14000 [Clostridium perfringens]|nr:hypothetical protein [Clostridium perfringens]